MAQSTFSGPVKSNNGFIVPVVVTADLPSASSVVAGTVYMVSDNGASNNEYCIVISDGSTWVTAVGAALS